MSNRFLFYSPQKFDNRKCMVRESEQQYWDPLTLDYMTEESDDESDPSRIIEHKLPWRSPGKISIAENIVVINLEIWRGSKPRVGTY